MAEDPPSETSPLLGRDRPPPPSWTDTVQELLSGGRRRQVTAEIAQRNDINARKEYWGYYFPFLKWMGEYELSRLPGDFLGALTIGSIYIPMVLSMASNLAHIPAINGLYTFIFGLLVYSFMGSSPTMIVGPEVPCSLLTGQAVLQYSDIHDEERNAQIAGIVTLTGGIVIFLAGIFRLGFLDDVLSRPFLRGFIGSIGVVIVFEQLVTMLGLNQLKHGHMSAAEIVRFIVSHLGRIHTLTTVVSLSAFFVLLALREAREKLSARWPGMASVPDRFVIVVVATLSTYYFDWESKGLEVMGDVKLPGSAFPVRVPYRPEDLKIARELFGTSFVIALLGFFESSVSSKSIQLSREKEVAESIDKAGGGGKPKSAPIPPTANREFISLGAANILGGFFMTLSIFGGYGRSRVGMQAGATTPAVGLILAGITTLCVLYLAPSFYYIPRGVLSAMIADVGTHLVKEANPDFAFFWRIGGWSELFLMLTIFCATIFWDLKMGMIVGVSISVLRIIRDVTRSRVEILGCNPATGNFENAEAAGYYDDGTYVDESQSRAASPVATGVAGAATAGGTPQPQKFHFLEGCLVVRIPGPLSFYNTGSLQSRINRLMNHGTSFAHPGLTPTRDDRRHIVIDLSRMTRIDGAGVQVLKGIIDVLEARKINVFLCGINESVTRTSVATGQPDPSSSSTPSAGVSSAGPAQDRQLLVSRGNNVKEQFRKAGILDLVSEDRLAADIPGAVAKIRALERRLGDGLGGSDQTDALLV